MIDSLKVSSFISLVHFISSGKVGYASLRRKCKLEVQFVTKLALTIKKLTSEPGTESLNYITSIYTHQKSWGSYNYIRIITETIFAFPVNRKTFQS